MKNVTKGRFQDLFHRNVVQIGQNSERSDGIFFAREGDQAINNMKLILNGNPSLAQELKDNEQRELNKLKVRKESRILLDSLIMKQTKRN